MIIRQKQILDKITHPRRSLENLAMGNAQRVFDVKKRLLLGNLNKHPVSQELNAGADGENITGTLGGRSGNLFAFIGFPAGSDPVGELWDILNQETRMVKKAKSIQRKGKILTYSFLVLYPFMEELYNMTPYKDWGPGSWLRGIEHGISNLRFYLYSLKVGPWSRSGMAIQSKHVVRDSPGSSTGTKYMTEILQNFKKMIED